MVLNCKDFLRKIEDTPWFVNCGQAHSFYTSAGSLNKAADLWKSSKFEEVNSVAWESFRKDIPSHNKEIWEKCFIECKTILIRTLENSSRSNELLLHCQQDVEDFILLLPHVGAIGESLTENAKLNFFTNQLKIYEAGHWVCGWQGDLHDDEFIYPESNFIVF